MSQGDFISSSDFADLKTNINTEFSRRNIPTSVNDSNLNQFTNDFSNSTNSNSVIYTEHATKTIDYLINYIKGKSLVTTTNAGDLIPPLENYYTIVNNLKSVTDKTSTQHGCQAICVGLCYGACYSGCEGCTNACSGSKN